MPPRETDTVRAWALLPVRETVNEIGSRPASAPAESMTATVTTAGVEAGALMVMLWVRTVWLPKTSVAVHVMVVVPRAKRFPLGTPVRVTTTSVRGMLSVAVALPMVVSLR